MLKVLVVSEDSRAAREICSRLETTIPGRFYTAMPDETLERLSEDKIDIVFIEVSTRSGNRDLTFRIKEHKEIPIIAGLPRSLISSDGALAGEADDFILSPYDASELAIRIKRLLNEPAPEPTGNLIVCGDLTLDPARCEVKLAGEEVDLAFKEYELLKFLMTNRGRVFTREALLNKVWGDNYFGGDRTVDVHIRRIRSKIEIHNHSFIDTVRNIGYRFTENTGTA